MRRYSGAAIKVPAIHRGRGVFFVSYYRGSGLPGRSHPALGQGLQENHHFCVESLIQGFFIILGLCAVSSLCTCRLAVDTRITLLIRMCEMPARDGGNFYWGCTVLRPFPPVPHISARTAFANDVAAEHAAHIDMGTKLIGSQPSNFRMKC